MNSPITREFFATVQNKLHYAITKQTAAELIYERADSAKPNMGLTTWKNAPKGKIRKSDVVIAKNYLDETEMSNLNEIVTMYLDYAERQARRGNIMYMRDWVSRLDAFLREHAKDPKKANLQPLEVKFSGLTKFEARAMEQALISAYSLENLINARREIATGNVGGFAGKIGNIISIFGGAVEDELLNLMGR